MVDKIIVKNKACDIALQVFITADQLAGAAKAR